MLPDNASHRITVGQRIGPDVFLRQRSGAYVYLQIVESFREQGQVRQRVLSTVGRLDVLQQSGQLENLIRSGLRFCDNRRKPPPGLRVLEPPRCTKDWIEEALFEQRRDLFSELNLVFFDTTSLYFEGEGGQEIGEYGHSKDHRPDLKQMVVGLVLDAQGWPLCCELWPGNTADSKTLLSVP